MFGRSRRERTFSDLSGKGKEEEVRYDGLPQIPKPDQKEENMIRKRIKKKCASVWIKYNMGDIVKGLVGWEKGLKDGDVEERGRKGLVCKRQHKKFLDL